MADEEEKKEEDVKAEKEPEEKKSEEKKSEKTSGIGILTWVIIVATVIICAGAGFGLSRWLTGSSKSETNESVNEDNQKTDDDDSATNSQDTWYYDLEPVVANLDEPGVTRYIRAAITLEIRSRLGRSKGEALFEAKKPVLTNWLNIYLASLSIEDIRGDKNLKRIQLQILDAFNEELFPDAKPQIKYILFKEFAIQ